MEVADVFWHGQTKGIICECAIPNESLTCLNEFQYANFDTSTLDIHKISIVVGTFNKAEDSTYILLLDASLDYD